MRLFSDKNDPLAEHNREVFFDQFNKKTIAAKLVHGNRVTIVDNNSAAAVEGSDALVTDDSNLVLSITVADCLPLYFYDPTKKVIGLAHAGWRGVENRISLEVVKTFEQNYHSVKSDIQVFIGPHIGACHFEVRDDVAKKFLSWPEFITERAGKIFIDLAGIVRQQLLDFGVPIENINISSECTYCLSDKYFSFRRDNPGEDNMEVMTAYIGLK